MNYNPVKHWHQIRLTGLCLPQGEAETACGRVVPTSRMTRKRANLTCRLCLRIVKRELGTSQNQPLRRSPSIRLIAMWTTKVRSSNPIRRRMDPQLQIFWTIV